MNTYSLAPSDDRANSTVFVSEYENVAVADRIPGSVGYLTVPSKIVF